jgi:hypothetical protein
MYTKKQTADIIENYYQKCPKLNLENRIFTHKNYYCNDGFRTLNCCLKRKNQEF